MPPHAVSVAEYKAGRISEGYLLGWVVETDPIDVYP